MFLKKDNNDKIAITDNGEVFSYFDAREFSDKFVNIASKRSLIFSFNSNNIESLFGYLACLDNKFVPLMLDSKIDNGQLKKLLDIYQPNYLWISSDRSEDFKDKKVVLIYKNYCLIEYAFNENISLNENLALLLTTSGSTGSPKLVRLTYDNIYQNSLSIVNYLNISENDRPITTLPMHYSFGLSVINSHLMKGAVILLTNLSIMERGFWEFLKNEKASSLSGVPYSYQILKKLRFFKMDYPHLNVLTQAGGKLSDALISEYIEYCHNNDKKFIVMYGQTEATARMSYLPHNTNIEKVGSIGLPIPNGSFELVNEEGIVIDGPEVNGELVYKGPNVSMGYAECYDDLSLGDVNKGALLTGDIACRDTEGYYYIVGRKKRFIKIFGNRINLDEAESILKNFIEDSACTGEDDKMFIYITQKDMEISVKKYMNSKTGIPPSAMKVQYISSIPKNTAGKVIYNNLN